MNHRDQTLNIFLDRDEAARAIRQLSEDDLIFLNTQIIERLKLIQQAQSTIELARFSVGDRVSFPGPAGQTITGTIIKLNKKTAGVQSNDGRQWKVSPSLLTHQAKAKDTRDGR